MLVYRFCTSLLKVSAAVAVAALLLLGLVPGSGYPAVQADTIYLPLITKPQPTGTGRILYAGGHPWSSIFAVSANGTGYTRLTSGAWKASEPDWSPDGQKIVFVGKCGGQGGFNLCIINADGSGLVPLTQYDAVEKCPAWSPDGTRIAFSSNLGGLYSLYTVNADGTNRVQLTVDSSDFDPAWSPDGSKIAFESNRDDAMNPELYVMDLATGTVTRLTNDLGTDWAPAWSPDGSTIAWEHNYEIYLMNADGTNQRKLTTAPNQDFSPTWSPDGEWIAFDRQAAPHSIGVIRKNGSDYYEIVPPAGAEPEGQAEPSWGP